MHAEAASNGVALIDQSPDIAVVGAHSAVDENPGLADFTLQLVTLNDAGASGAELAKSNGTLTSDPSSTRSGRDCRRDGGSTITSDPDNPYAKGHHVSGYYPLANNDNFLIFTNTGGGDAHGNRTGSNELGSRRDRKIGGRTHRGRILRRKLSCYRIANRCRVGSARKYQTDRARRSRTVAGRDEMRSATAWWHIRHAYTGVSKS